MGRMVVPLFTGRFLKILVRGRTGHPLGAEKNLPGIGSYPSNAYMGQDRLESTEIAQRASPGGVC